MGWKDWSYSVRGAIIGGLVAVVLFSISSVPFPPTLYDYFLSIKLNWLNLLMIVLGTAISGSIIGLIKQQHNNAWWKYIIYLGIIPFVYLLLTIILLLLVSRGDGAEGGVGLAVILLIATFIAVILGFLIGLFRMAVLKASS